MSEHAAIYTTADAVRARNAELDAALDDELDRLDPARLHQRQVEGEWTPAELLAHLGEFPAFFAADLTHEFDSPGSPVGRTLEHPLRNQAVAQAPHQELAELRAAILDARVSLDAMLARLEDADLNRTVTNVRYGPEPLTTYLDRYILGHKLSHLEQLRQLRAEG